MEARIKGRSVPMACSSWSFGILPLEKSVRIIRVLGFDRVDVGFSHIRFDPSASSLQQGRELNRKLRNEGIAISDLFPALPFETNDPNSTHRKRNRMRFEQILGFAVGIESPGITLKPGTRQTMNDEEGWQICLDVLGEFCLLARKEGLRLSVEPHVESIIEVPKRARELVAGVDGLKITLDYSHFIAMDCAIDDVKILHPYTAHLHLRQARKGRVQIAAKNGVIPVRRILGDLIEGGYSGVISMEYQNSDWQQCNDIDVVTETVVTLRELGLET